MRSLDDLGMPMTKARRKSQDARASAAHIARSIATIMSSARPNSSELPLPPSAQGASAFQRECLEILDGADDDDVLGDDEDCEECVLRHLLRDWSSLLDERDATGGAAAEQADADEAAACYG